MLIPSCYVSRLLNSIRYRLHLLHQSKQNLANSFLLLITSCHQKMQLSPDVITYIVLNDMWPSILLTYIKQDFRVFGTTFVSTHFPLIFILENNFIIVSTIRVFKFVQHHQRQTRNAVLFRKLVVCVVKS